MTAILTITKPDGVTMFTDGAMLEDGTTQGPLGEGGIVSRIDSKVFLVGRRAVLAGTGAWSIPRQAASLAFNYLKGELDLIVAQWREIRRGFIEAFEEAPPGVDVEWMRDAQFQQAKVIIAGKSTERDRFETWIGTLASNTPSRVGAVSFPGYRFAIPEVNRLRFAGRWSDDVHGVALFEKLRGDGYPIGGFVEKTTIDDAHGFASTILHRWPDETGKPLQRKAA